MANTIIVYGTLFVFEKNHSTIQQLTSYGKFKRSKRTNRFG